MQIQTYELAEDMLLHCISASSFPDGVLTAHKTLHSLVPFDPNRNYFGISWPDANGNIIYKAAAAELHPGEYANHSLETKKMEKGNYYLIVIENYMENMQLFGEAFQLLIAQPDIDPQGFCIEWYKDMQTCYCLVKKITH